MYVRVRVYVWDDYVYIFICMKPYVCMRVYSRTGNMWASKSALYWMTENKPQSSPKSKSSGGFSHRIFRLRGNPVNMASLISRLVRARPEKRWRESKGPIRSPLSVSAVGEWRRNDGRYRRINEGTFGVFGKCTRTPILRSCFSTMLVNLSFSTYKVLKKFMSAEFYSHISPFNSIIFNYRKFIYIETD